MKVTLTPEPSTERTDMTELSADLALADAEARESRERVRFEAWASQILGDNPTWRGSGACELVWQAWQAALAPAVPQWMPIETAPKTGRKLIVFYMNRNNKARTVMARWLTDEQAAETDTDDVGLEGGWYECIDNWDDYTEVEIHEGEPMLWLPLPAAPSAKEPQT